MMSRMDETYRNLKSASQDPAKSAEEVATVKTELATREKHLLPTYTQIALQFADLHDRASRMKAKGTIRQALDWTESRKYFYWRLKRRLQEESVLARLAQADPSLKREQHQESLREVLSELVSSAGGDLEDDVAVTEALERNEDVIGRKVSEAKKSNVVDTIARLSRADRDAFVEGVRLAFGEQAARALES